MSPSTQTLHLPEHCFFCSTGTSVAKPNSCYRALALHVTNCCLHLLYLPVARFAWWIKTSCHLLYNTAFPFDLVPGWQLRSQSLPPCVCTRSTMSSSSVHLPSVRSPSILISSRYHAISCNTVSRSARNQCGNGGNPSHRLCAGTSSFNFFVFVCTSFTRAVARSMLSSKISCHLSQHCSSFDSEASRQ
jgi:hypothetical protein